MDLKARASVMSLEKWDITASIAWARASRPVLVVSFGGIPIAKVGISSAKSGTISLEDMGIFLFAFTSVTTHKPVHSEPVPLVVGMATRIAFFLSSNRVNGETVVMSVMSGRS